MGYNQNYAGIHLIPRGYRGIENYQSFDKYDLMIAEAQEKKYRNSNLNNSVDTIMKEVEVCNFVMIARKRGEIKRCVCGGKLKYCERLTVKFHNKGVMTSIQMTGKQCVDCDRKLIIKKEVLQQVSEFIQASE